MPSSGEVEGWQLREVYEQSEEPGLPSGIGSYGLVIEKCLTLADEARTEHATGVELIGRIERLWPFAAGVPFGGLGFGVFLSTVQTPKGWKSNVSEVDQAIQGATQELIVGEVRFTRRFWHHAPAFPLPALLRAIEAYAKADEIIKALIDLHYEAHHSDSKHGRGFLWAQGLEIVKELLPGKDDRARMASLSPEVRAALTQPLARLYEISNRRRTTRHVITKQPTLALHPQMQGNESSEFAKNADLLIRNVVCNSLGLEVFIFQDGPAP